MAPAATERVRRFYDQAAAHYDGWMRPFDRVFLEDGRASVCGRARGQTLEIAVGTGLNLPHYSPGVQLTAIDLSSTMLHIAAHRAEALGLRAAFEQADAQCLPYAHNSFDSVVCTLALCEIPDERAAIAEALRVLRPGGRLLLLEHARSPMLLVRLGQVALAPLMHRLANDHLLRDPMDHLARMGFTVESCERSRWGIVERIVARKPPSPGR
jgi:ubiquinone/menaquinone biosynthesis C-methylase UbiE